MTNPLNALKVKTLEKNARFSKSILWDLQREYFESQGIQAWVGQVPFYITSNPFIAHAYAQICMAYIQDQLARNLDSSHPIYILELGTGSGKFSYLCMKQLFELQTLHQLDHLNIVYIMSDFTESNLKFWQTHPQFQTWLEQGKLDFCIFNLDQATEELQLTESGKTLNATSIHNPIIALGNYIFDTVTHDAFHVNQGKLHEAQINTQTDSRNIQKGKVLDLTKLSTEFSYTPCDAKSYYADAARNHCLQHYEKELKDGSSFLMPHGALTCLDTLRVISSNRCLILATDKGYNHLEELQHLPDPGITFHGSFSMMVNFHAIGQYAKQAGGDAFVQSPRPGIKTSAFVLGDVFQKLTQTQHALQAHVEQFSVSNFFQMHSYFKRERAQMDLKMLHTHLVLGRWDPYFFLDVQARIIELIEHADEQLKRAFIAAADKLTDNHFILPDNNDLDFDIGLMLYYAAAYEKALTYFRASEAKLPLSFHTQFNIALCLHNLGLRDQARPYFEKALALDPSSQACKDFLAASS